MKKIMRRILIIFIILVTLFEFSCSSNVCYAALEITDEFVNSLTGLMGGMVAYGIWLKRLILLGVSTVFNGYLSTSYAACCGVNSEFSVSIATPYSIFFNKYVLFDVNFFDLTETVENKPIIDIRNAVADWFYIMRNISSAVLLCILIYVGIRMALSTVAEEKAKYKKMFFDWACSLALIYILQYIIMFTVYGNNAIVNALKAAYEGSDLDNALLQIALQAVMPVGISSIVATIVYCMIVLQTIAFMISYTMRMLKTGFLILISPLISITYSIDKMGDGKAQALNSWFKEFVYTILIQPFHCLIYMAFVTTAVTLLGESTILAAIGRLFAGEFNLGEFNQITNGVLVILCLKFINDGEKAIKKIFNFQDDDSLTSMAAGAMVGVAALKGAQNMGSKATSTINSAKNMYSRYGGSVKADFNKFKNTDRGKKLMASAEKFKDNANKFKDNVKNNEKFKKLTDNKATNFAKNTGKWVAKETKGLRETYRDWSRGKHEEWGKDGNDESQNKYIRGAKSWLRKQVPTAQNLRNAMPGALGLMAASMSYAAGDNGVLEAIGTGAAIQKGSEDYFSTTLGTIADEADRRDKTLDNSLLDQAKQSADNAIISSARGEDGKVNERYNTAEKRDAVVQQYIRDQRSLEIEEAQKGGVSKERLAEIDKNRKQLEDDGVLGAVIERAGLEGEGGEEFKRKEAQKRRDNFEKYGIGAKYGPDAIKKQGEEILNALKELKQKQKNDALKNDAKEENKLGDKDTTSPERMFETLKKVIDHSVVNVSGGSFNISEIMQNELGIHDDSTQEYQEIAAAVLAYRMMIANDRAEEPYENWEKLLGSREDIHRKNS